MTNTINQTHDFSVWLLGVNDVLARAAILIRIKRAALRNFGDYHDVGGSVWEMRIHTGAGCRVYYVRDGLTVYLPLAGEVSKGRYRISPERRPCGSELDGNGNELDSHLGFRCIRLSR
ncbi:hypothetical protein M0D69_12290 [Caballeronia sp. SEWSISQ10-4 2]|uniref:type II toxin-antitoxin system RelE/ParE family toxin n=1 Tax=Caballeronia sp. SEWSISQ10-4 2 TaxID=2937438 RepID=UPI002654C218|nr:type II toxin-antitoxin system RelE/ParE family toxin [Caballeronia sp. SEWSISQ10-4 2]MDN7178781.1 hypothetical protein [Caballeronia sp. SEWSISQ10-4 2]